jgi:hypothetical protein
MTDTTNLESIAAPIGVTFQSEINDAQVDTALLKAQQAESINRITIPDGKRWPRRV